MRNLKRLATLLIIILGIFGGCQADKSTRQEKMRGGVYTGVIPCADCEGISYELSLQNDNQYRSSSVYLGKSNRPFVEKGSWNIEQDSLLILKEDSKIKNRFAIHEDELVMLNQNGEPNTGSLSSMYVLQKKDSVSQKSSWNKLRKKGTDFHATGNEPFWSLSIDFDNTMSFKALDGDSIQTPVPEMKRDTTTQARVLDAEPESGSLNVKLYPIGCRDDMSGKVFDYRVEVEAGGKSFSGCGNFITQKYRLHDYWSLYSLNGNKITDKTEMRQRPVLHFDVTRDKVSGNTGCNQLNGSFTLADSSLTFSKMATTRMACPGDTESKFLNAIQSIDSYHITHQELLLMSGRDTAMVFRRSE